MAPIGIHGFLSHTMTAADADHRGASGDIGSSARRPSASCHCSAFSPTKVGPGSQEATCYHLLPEMVNSHITMENHHF